MAELLKDVYKKRAVLSDAAVKVCCRAYFSEKIWGCIWLGDRELVKWCKIFLKKVVGKFGGMGILVVPLQPQTGNGGSRQPRRQKKVLAVTEKVVTFAEPAAGVAEGGNKTFEMMLQTI